MTGNRVQSINASKEADSCRLQFLSIGHFTHDIVGRNLILGGAAAYSSATARKLGLRVGVVTAVGSDFLYVDKFGDISLSFVDLDAGRDNQSTTTFQNIYENGIRKQFIRRVSATIRSEHIPEKWCDSSIIYLCPVANEIEPSVVSKFPNSVIGVSPQGWMRRWDSEGRVYAQRWDDAKKVLPYTDVLVMSEEDIAPFPDVVEEYISLAKIVVLTRGDQGSTLFHDGEVVNFPAFEVSVADPTGAGDVFATAFLIKYQQTGNPHEASIFANCAASFVVENKGTEGIASLAQINERLAKFID